MHEWRPSEGRGVLKCVQRPDGLIGCCCRGRLAFGVRAGHQEASQGLANLARGRLIELSLPDPVALLVRYIEAGYPRRGRHLSQSKVRKRDEKAGGRSPRSLIYGHVLTPTIAGLPYSVSLEVLREDIVRRRISIRWLQEPSLDDDMASWLLWIRTPFGHLHQSHLSAADARKNNFSDQQGLEVADPKMLDAWRKSLRTWHCEADAEFASKLASWTRSDSMQLSIAMPWVDACAEGPSAWVGEGGLADTPGANMVSPSSFALCLSGQRRGSSDWLLTRSVCAASLPQHTSGDGVDVFVFAFLSNSRCGACWDATCPDRGLGRCVRYSGGKPEDALSSVARASAEASWIRALRKSVSMCQGSNFGQVGVAEDWEFDQAGVGDRYFLPRERGLTQSHYPIQLWGVQQCFRLVVETERQFKHRYDAILRARLDTFWFAPLPALRPLLKRASVLVRAATNDELHRNPSDQFAFVPRQYAKVYFVQWLENLANETFLRNVHTRVTERWNKFIGGEGSLMLAFEEHGVPYERHPFPFSVYRPRGRCFNLGQPPGPKEGCMRALSGVGTASFEALVDRCVNHTCCNSYGVCEDHGDVRFGCRCRPLPMEADFDFFQWLVTDDAYF